MSGALQEVTPLPNPAFSSRETEYWYNVMSQGEMPIAGEITLSFDLARVAGILKRLAAAGDAAGASTLAAELLSDPSTLSELRQMLGITDKRAYLELSFRASRAPHPRNATMLCGCQPWTMARHTLKYFENMLGAPTPKDVRAAAAVLMATYLLDEGLHEVSRAFTDMTTEQLEAVYRTLVVPKEMQQKLAKRRGHGCEAALAGVLIECGVTVIPPDKATNPLGAYDPHLDFDTLQVVDRRRGETHSFDIVVANRGSPRIVVQSLIHTSDPGQYGVDKSNETVAIADALAQSNLRIAKGRAPVELWGLLDGIGFSENKSDTLNKMLGKFDTFLQLNTLWKAPLRLHQLSMCRVEAIRFDDFYTPADIDAIAGLYVAAGITVLGRDTAPPLSTRVMTAGRAQVYLRI